MSDENKKVVPMYSEALYVNHSRKQRNVKPDRHLMASDGSSGYGGSEFTTEAYDFVSAPDDKKYKWQNLWNEIPEDTRVKLQCDSVGLFSVTAFEEAEEMSRIILNLPGVDSDSEITDATACVGGNCFSFMKHFKTLNAVELSPERCTMLRHNLSLIQKQFNLSESYRFKVLEGDCLKIVPNLTQKIIFFDPPWGGQAYKSRETISLLLSGKRIGQIVHEVSSCADFFAIKLPIDCVDVEEIIRDSGCLKICCETVGSKAKMRLLVLQRKKLLDQKQLNFLRSCGLK